MYLRKYISSDCKQLTILFYQTIHCINAKDYTKEQLNAWANDDIDLIKWNESFLKNYTIVAVDNNEIIGFGDINESGYLDRLYIHKNHQREGIATAICDKLENAVSAKKITTHASITAKPFFENRGYLVIKEQIVIRNGISLINYMMEKQMR